MIYLSGVLEVELKSGEHALVVAAWLETHEAKQAPMFLGFDPKTHKPRVFSMGFIEKINSVLVR